MRRRLFAILAIPLVVGCSDQSANDNTAATSAAANAAATGNATDSIRVTDDAGAVVALGSPAQRVIAMIPAQTEVVKILGGASRLVARTQWDTDPELAKLPSTGNALTPSVEWLAAQHPDLVIAWPDNDSRNIIQQLKPLHIPVYSSRVETMAQIASMITRIGKLLGTDARADSLNQAIAAQLDSVRATVNGLKKPTVLYALSVDPPMAAGAGTYVNDIIEAAGGTNIFASLNRPWPQVSLEDIVRQQPDVILLPTGDSDSGSLRAMKTRAGWRDLKAVREGRVYEVDANLFNRPGATVGIAARKAASLLHPEAVNVR